MSACVSCISFRSVSISCPKTNPSLTRLLLLLVEALARRSACGFLCRVTASRESRFYIVVFQESVPPSRFLQTSVSLLSVSQNSNYVYVWTCHAEMLSVIQAPLNSDCSLCIFMFTFRTFLHSVPHGHEHRAAVPEVIYKRF